MRQILLLTILALAVGCQQMNPCGFSSNAFLDNYEDFVDDVAEKDLGTKAKAWEPHDQRFEKFVDECYPNYENDLTRSEQSRFAATTVKYLYHRYAGSFVNDLEDNETLERELEELGKTIGTYAEKFGAEVSVAMDELVRELDREKLNKMFEDIGKFFEDLDITIDTGKEN